jgi:CSLREA domain-containing protein
MALVAPATAGAVTIPVTAGTADSVADDQLCSLREAISTANANTSVNVSNGADCPHAGGAGSDDEITLPAGTYPITILGNDSTNQTGDFDVHVGGTITNPGDLRIEGAGEGSTIIDPNDADRIFDVHPTDAASSFELEGMTVRDGTAPAGENGGGINSSNAVDITLNSVTLDQNTAFVRGGGIVVNGGNLVAVDSAIQNNVINASANGDFGAGISANLTNVDVTDSSVTGNDANLSGNGSGSGVSGGGILAINGSLDITRSTVDANRLDMLNGAANIDFPDGGGVYTRNSDVTITESAVTNNVVTGGNSNGGAGLNFWDPTAANADDSLRILNSTFSGNSATGAQGQEQGGAIAINGGINEVYFSTFTNNTASNGESIYSVGQAGQANRVLNLRASIFSEDGVECEHPNNLDPTTIGYNIDAGTSCTDNPVGGSIGDQRNTAVSLGALASNGGPTRTHELLSGSNGIDDIPVGDCLTPTGADNTRDQRGILRPSDGDAVPGSSCDIGAYERSLCNNAAVTISGTGADETINGTSGNDVIAAEGGADTVNAGDGADTVCGGSGNDTIRTGTGADADSAFGGADADTISFSDLSAGLTTATILDLANGSATGTDSGSDTLNGFENLTGTNFSDGSGGSPIQGNFGGNVMDGLDGNDTLQGSGGNDTLTGGSGTEDVVSFVGTSDSPVTASLTGGTATIAGGLTAGTDTLNGFENLTGGAQGDTLIGDGGPNDFNGFSGDDTLDGRDGADSFTGGPGAADTVTFAGLPQAVDATLALGSLTAVGQGSDSGGSGIENLTGSSQSDDLTGDTGANTLDGGDGNDLLADGVNATANADVFIGGAGADDRLSYLARTDAGDAITLNLNQTSDNGGQAGENDDVQASVEGVLSGAGADNLIGDENENTFSAGGGDDTLDGRGGNDVLVGEGGTDTVTYANLPGPVTVDLFLGATGAQGGDFFSLNENVTGSPGDDTLTGDAGPNTLSGLGGSDTLDGRANNDSLVGGDQVDTATYANSPDPIVADLPNAQIIGEGTDPLTSVENVTGSAGPDVFLDLDGAANSYDGGGNADMVDFADAAAGVTLNLETGAGSDGTSVVSIEDIAGSPFDDTLTGDDQVNNMIGRGGNDTMTGALGEDEVFGAGGADNLLVRDGISDTVDCGSGDAANDTVESDLSGVDTVQDCEGGDSVTFAAPPVDPTPANPGTTPPTKPKCKKGRKLKKVKGKFKCVKKKRKKK